MDTSKPNTSKGRKIKIISLLSPLMIVAYFLFQYALGLDFYLWKVGLIVLSGTILLTPIFAATKNLDILWILSLVLIIVLMFFLALLVFPCHIYQTNKLTGGIIFLLLAFTILTYAISAQIIYRTDFFRIKIALRIFAIVMILLCDIVMIAFSIKHYANFWKLYGFSSFWKDNDAYFCGISFKLWVDLGIIVLILGLWNYVFIKPKAGHLLLYLRSFKYDKEQNNERLLDILDDTIAPSFNYKILRIGNPNTFGFFSSCNTYFLSTSNWKKEVAAFIKKVETIFVVISSTSGVLWEIYNHQKEYAKFIFYLPKISDLEDILSDIHTKQPQFLDADITQLFQYLLFLKTDDRNNGCLFYYYSGKWFYIIVKDINETQLNSIFSHRRDAAYCSENSNHYIDIKG